MSQTSKTNGYKSKQITYIPPRTTGRTRRTGRTTGRRSEQERRRRRRRRITRRRITRTRGRETTRLPQLGGGIPLPYEMGNIYHNLKYNASDYINTIGGHPGATDPDPTNQSKLGNH